MQRSDAGWESLLPEFRDFGGIAENVTLREGPRGRGLYPIDPAMPILLSVPSDLLIPEECVEVREGHLAVKASTKLGARERAFFERYQREVSWSAGVFDELWREQLAWSQLPQEIQSTLREVGWIIGLDNRFSEPTAEVCFERYLVTRRITHRGGAVLMPLLELVNHSSKGLMFRAEDRGGIMIGGVCEEEVLVNYSLDDCWGRVSMHSFCDPTDHALSLGFSYRTDGLLIEIQRDTKQKERVNELALPLVHVKDDTVNFSHLMLGHIKTPGLPRAIFLDLAKNTPIRRPDELFDVIQHYNRMQLLRVLRVSEVSMAPLVVTLRTAALQQLAALSHHWGTGRPERLVERLQQASTLHQTGDVAQARTIYEEILAIDPSHADAVNLLGAIALQTGDPHRAVELFERATQLDPTNMAAYCNCALALMQSRRFDAALARYDHVIATGTEIAEVYFHRGNALGELKQFEAALASYQRAIEIETDYAEAYLNAARALRELGRVEETLVHCERAISLVADYEEAYLMRGAALASLNRLDSALASFDQAIALRSDYAEAYSNRGNVLAELKRLDEALVSFNIAIQLRPNFAEAHLNRSLTLLLRGDFENGLVDYDWRLKNDDGSLKDERGLLRSQWRGQEPLADKRILLYAEQGLGDTLQFCRYAPLVAELDATVILQVPRELKQLLATLQGVSELVTPEDPLPDTDYQCPLLSLPMAYRTRLGSIPSSTRYLAGDAAKVAQWKTLLGPRNQARIGVAWRSNLVNRNSRKRNVALADLIQCLPAGLQYVSLQKDLSEEDTGILRAETRIRQFPDELLGFVDTAALCECMDLVISVDTSLAHLSGALGKPTWILLPWVPDWRWLLDREDSPWYPTVKLYRQDKLGNWNDVLERVNADLIRKFQSS